MSDQCADAEHVASWRAYMASNPEWMTERTPNVYREGFIAGMAHQKPASPIAMRIPCPSCGELHIDDGDFATKPHHTHSCQSCGLTWRPAVVHTVGVRFLPGFKNEATSPAQGQP